MKSNKKKMVWRRTAGTAAAIAMLFMYNQCVKQYDKNKKVDIEPIQQSPGDNDDEIDDDNGPLDEEADITPEGESESGDTEVARTAASVGVLNFEQIDASFAAITGIDRRMHEDVNTAYLNNFLALPNNNNVKEYSAANTMGVFKVASAYCSRMSRETGPRDQFFSGIINVNQSPNAVLSSPTQKSDFIDGMIARVWGEGVGSDETLEPTKQELMMLLDELLEGEDLSRPRVTRIVAVGICAAMLSSPQIIYL